MDKLEEYLDQVCRRMGGPRALRQHVRQELSEHLRDAAAEHRKAGLSDDEALDRALNDFGKPDEVRSELEAAHGHRLMAVVIDKAIEWKEMTMKAKWLWTSWAHLAPICVIALGLGWIVFASVFIVPKFQKLMQDGMIDPALIFESHVGWTVSFPTHVGKMGGYALALILLATAAWGLFEWRVRSDNKTTMRLAVLGTVAVGILVVAVLVAFSLVVSFCVGVPQMGGIARLFALDQIAQIETSVSALEQALAKKDWEVMQKHATDAARGLENLAKTGPAVPALASRELPSTVAELRDHVRDGRQELSDALQAISEKDAEKLTISLRGFHKSFSPVHEAAKRLPK